MKQRTLTAITKTKLKLKPKVVLKQKNNTLQVTLDGEEKLPPYDGEKKRRRSKRKKNETTLNL